MGSGGDRKHEETSDAQELFAYRYWYTWETAQKWPTASVVLCRYRAECKWQYSLISYFQPDRPPVFMPDFPSVEYLLIERDPLQGAD